MIIIFLVLVISFAVYRGLRVKKARIFLCLLLSILVLGFNNLIIHIALTRKADCGKYFDRDLGCSNILPGWFVIFTLGLLFLATTISLYVAIKFKGKS